MPNPPAMPAGHSFVAVLPYIWADDPHFEVWSRDKGGRLWFAVWSWPRRAWSRFRPNG